MRYLFPVIAAMTFCATGVAQATTTERFDVMTDGQTIGHLTARVSDRTVDIDFAVDENGRGPHHKEHLVLAPSRVPIEWSIAGTSETGGAVREHFSWKNGMARWTSQADQGQQESKAPRLYIGNDTSPWSLGLYARALQAAPSGTLNVLPGGRLSLENRHPVSLPGAATNNQLEAVVLVGLGLSPQIVILDNRGDLVASLDDEMVVREDYAKQYPALEQLRSDITLELLSAKQKQLAHRYEVPVHIRNVRLFDPQTLTTTAPLSLTVFRGTITTIAPDVAVRNTGDEVEIDGDGGTLVAGLHDMHSHNSFWSGLYYLAAGVTTTRDMGNSNVFLLDLMKRLEAGEIPGPHIIPSGFLEGRSPYSAQIGFVIGSLDEGLRDVQWYGDRGYLQIKIYNSMNPDWVKPLATRARELGMRTVGHVPAFTTPDRMIEDGYNEVTHLSMLMLGWLLSPGEDTRTTLRLSAMVRAADLDLNTAPVRHTIELMKKYHTGVDTTAVIDERLMLSRARRVAEADAPYLDHMPISYQRNRKRSFFQFKNRAEEDRYDRAFNKMVETMALLHREGISLWPGTDDDTGFTLHRELELYVRAGMTPAQALRRASFDCDQYLSREQQFGSLERGKRADFFLVAGDPTKDITAVRRIRLVMKGGVIYYPAEIYESLGIKPFASPPAIHEPVKH